MLASRRIITTLVSVICTTLYVYHVVQLNGGDIFTDVRRRLEEVSDSFHSGSVISQSFEDKRQKFCVDRALRIKVIGRDQPVVPSQYPSLLCNADNSLKENSIPRDWSACYRTRIGTGVYDVIVLDYFEVADQALVDLAIRTRLRFPNALIVNLKHWYPIWTGYFSAQEGWVTVKQWAEALGYQNMTNEALVEFNRSTLAWETFTFSSEEPIFTEATKRSEAWTFFKGSDNDATLMSRGIQDLTYRRSFMYGNWDYRNGKGDWDVANGILDLFEHLDVKRNDTVNGWYGNDDHADCFM